MIGRFVLVVGALAACGTDVGAPPEAALPRRLRLVTDTQYRNAVRDLLGDVDVPEIHAPGTLPHQFIHDDNVLAVDAPLLVQYRLAAETIARGADQCTDVACVEDFAARAFRRPLEAAEREGLGTMFAAGGFPLVVETVLQAPSFVYRSELGHDHSVPRPSGRGTETPDNNGELTSYELASQLGFLFLDSLPDEPLWQAARAGTIDVAAQVDRLLELPRVREHLTEVVLSWLDLHAIETLNRYELSTATRASMFEQTKRFVHDVLWNRGGSLRELLTSNRTFVDAQLAPYYGVEVTAWHMIPRVVDATWRTGLLAHPGVLAMLSTPFGESIIHRGLYVHRKFLCTEELGRPPFTAIRDTFALTDGFTEAQLAHFRSAHVYCSGCHRTIDPPGFAMHAYDGLGRLRHADYTGIPIEDDVVLSIDGTSHRIDGVADLGRVLADSDQVGRCVVDQLAHHAFGRALADRATRGYLERRFEASDRDLVELFRAIATSPLFTRRGPHRGQQ